MILPEYDDPASLRRSRKALRAALWQYVKERAKGIVIPVSTYSWHCQRCSARGEVLCDSRDQVARKIRLSHHMISNRCWFSYVAITVKMVR